MVCFSSTQHSVVVCAIVLLLLLSLITTGVSSVSSSTHHSPTTTTSLRGQPVPMGKPVLKPHSHFYHEPYLPCDRPWPNLTLFLPVYLMPSTAVRAHEWEKIFLKSFLFFWPHEYARTKLLVLVDEEQTQNNPDYEVFEQKLRHYAGAKMPPLSLPAEQKIVIKTNNYPGNWYANKGHDRQQLLMLYADEFVDSEYVGFVDTDCEFITYVDREDLFEDGKPVVSGRIGKVHDWAWYFMTGATKYFLNLDEPMRCMAYFPVIMKTAHIKEMREYIERLHGNKSLREELFLPMITAARGRYSQFSFMCAYIWHFHRDEYVWYASDTDPDYDFVSKFNILPGHSVSPPQGTLTNKSLLFSPQMLRPKPRIAVHTNYIEGMTNSLNREILKQGFCISPPFPNVHCQKYTWNNSDIPVLHKPGTKKKPHHFKESDGSGTIATFSYMHKFEDADYWKIYDTEVLKSEGRKRFSRLKTCVPRWDFSLYNNASVQAFLSNN